MRENFTNLRRLGWRIFALLTLAGCTLYVAAPPAARADDPIACQNSCFNDMVSCCGYTNAYCEAGCISAYYTCGGQCGNFQGKNCYERAADFYDQCVNNGWPEDYGCAAGDVSCCTNAYDNVLTDCLYP